jgi:hypothetical protein
MTFASSTTDLPASIPCETTSVATRRTRATAPGLRFAGRFDDVALVTRFALFLPVFFVAARPDLRPLRRAPLRVLLRAPLRAADLVELFARGPPRRRALPFFALFLDALFFLVAPFFREPDLRADFFLVAIRCAPRDE